MTKGNVKFNLKDRPEFVKELRKRVNSHFKDNNISKYSNASMKFKTVFMIVLYLVPLAYLLLWNVDFKLSLLLWALMGFGMSGIGLSIMHDANHGAYSKNQNVNNALGYLMNILGSYHVLWKVQHNVLHHSFTNVDGFDEDIEIAVMRFSPNQKRKGIYRFQVFYGPFLYCFLTLYKMLVKDFEQFNRYLRDGYIKGQGLTRSKAIAEFIFVKVAYFVLLLALPLYLIDLPWHQVLAGFLLMHFICGLFLTLIFQPAHVIEETEFHLPDESGSVENNWAIHQMKTTANFAHGSKFFSWFIGGLNYQVEHHLFPTICHVHYKDISSIVKKTAEEYGVPYHSYKTFYGALKSHFSLVNKLGKGVI